MTRPSELTFLQGLVPTLRLLYIDFVPGVPINGGDFAVVPFK